MSRRLRPPQELFDKERQPPDALLARELRRALRENADLQDGLAYQVKLVSASDAHVDRMIRALPLFLAAALGAGVSVGLFVAEAHEGVGALLFVLSALVAIRAGRGLDRSRPLPTRR
jgi:hypothetical protein